MEVIASELRSLQWKSRFIAPIAAVAKATVFGFSAITASHNEELHRRFLVDAVFYPFEPAIKPAQSPIFKRKSSFRRKLNFAGDISTLSTVRPRPDYQLLGRFLAFGKGLPVEHVLPAPGVIPTGDMIDRHVSITIDVVHD